MRGFSQQRTAGAEATGEFPMTVCSGRGSLLGWVAEL